MGGMNSNPRQANSFNPNPLQSHINSLDQNAWGAASQQEQQDYKQGWSERNMPQPDMTHQYRGQPSSFPQHDLKGMFEKMGGLKPNFDPIGKPPSPVGQPYMPTITPGGFADEKGYMRNMQQA